MTFNDLQIGDAVFLDANVLIYHFTNHPKFGAACTRLVERVENKELHAFTSAQNLADVAHRILTLEAMTILTWPPTALAARLKKHHHEIAKLSVYVQATSKVFQLGIQVLPVSEQLVVTATGISQKFELLTGDALIIATMQQQGLSKLASEDDDFDRVTGITRYSSQ